MSDHKTEKRPREIIEHICAEPGCEFEGQHAQQGVCHTADSWLADNEKLYQFSLEHTQETLRMRREHYPDDAEYIPWLESMYECAQLNWSFTLDECIRLRVENARLKLQLEKMKNEQST